MQGHLVPHSGQPERAKQLVSDLWRSGDLSDDAGRALHQSAAVQAIESGLGQFAAGGDLLLATILVDDSPSVLRHLAEIRRGHAKVFSVLQKRAAVSSILILTRLFNRGVLCPYLIPGRATHLTPENFNELLLLEYTPLYSQSLVTLGTVMAKAREAEMQGMSVRTFTLIITDGEDNPSPANEIRASTSDVKALVSDMTDLATNHIVAGFGIGERTNWYKGFVEMGIDPDWIIDGGTSDDELDAKFDRISIAIDLASTSSQDFQLLRAGTHPALPPGNAH